MKHNPKSDRGLDSDKSGQSCRVSRRFRNSEARSLFIWESRCAKEGTRIICATSRSKASSWVRINTRTIVVHSDSVMLYSPSNISGRSGGDDATGMTGVGYLVVFDVILVSSAGTKVVCATTSFSLVRVVGSPSAAAAEDVNIR